MIANMNVPRFLIKGFRPPREAVVSSLGPLERRVLEQTWRLEQVNVRAVVAALDHEFAYTTVMTTLDRLYKKGYLDRKRLGRAYIYSPCMSHEELQLGVLGDFIAGLLDDATRTVEPLLASIVDTVSDKDRNLLDELERLVKQKKASLDSD